MNAQTITATTTGGNWNAGGTWVGGVAPTSSNPVVIPGNSTVTVNVGTAACASLTINSGNNNQTGTLNFINTGVGVLTISGNLVIGGSGNRMGALNMTNVGTLKVGGAVSTGSISFTPGAGTIEYTGTTQTVASTLTPYNNLILSGSGTKPIGSVAADTLSMQGTTITSGTPGTINTIEYKGSSAQTTGTEFVASFGGTGGIVINNTNGVTLNANRTVSTKINFLNGKLSTSTFKLTLTNAIPANAILNASSSKYVVGTLEFTYPAGATTSLVYPIGTASIYAPFTITTAGVSGVVSIAAEPIAGFSTNDPVGTQPSGINRTNYAGIYWELAKTGAGSLTSYNAVFDFSNASPAGTPTSYVLRNYNGTSWSNIASPTAGATTISKTGLTLFGDYEAGEANTLSVASNPSNLTSCPASASFTSTSTSLPAPTIQWQGKAPAGSFANVSGGVYSGATTSTLTITPATGLSGYQYHAVFTNINGTVTSTDATLTLKVNPGVASVTATGGITLICPSATTNITANTITGTNAVLTWYTGAGGTGTNLGTANPLTVGPGTYYARIIGDCTPAAEASITITGKINPGVASVTAAGGNTAICPSTTTTITANTITGTNAVLTWWTGAGGTGTNLGSANPLTVSAGTYYARITGDCTPAAEASITITNKTNVSITNATATASPICASATTTITANGVAGTNAVLTWRTGPGGTGTNLGSANPLTVGPGTYYARITGDCGGPVETSVTVGSKINVGITNVTAAASPICNNATTTITANGVVGTNAVLTWWTGPNGTGTNLGNTNPLTAGPGTYYARVTGDCGTAAQANVTVASHGGGYIWTGAIDDDFTNTGNWLCGVVPPLGAAAAISLNANTIMRLTANLKAGDLTLNNNSRVNINGKELELAGTVTGAGKIMGSATSDLVISNTANIAGLSFAPGLNRLRNLTVNGNATLATALEMTAGAAPGRVLVNSGGVLNTGDSLVLKSNLNGTATVGNSAGTINGKVEVERYIRQNTYRGWRLMAVPVDVNSQSIRESWQEGATSYTADPKPGFGTRITANSATAVADGYDAQTYGNSLLYYDGTAWLGFTGNLTTTDVSRHGTADAWMLYIRGNRAVDTAGVITAPTSTILRAKGNLYQAPYPVVTIPANSNGLVGNILPSEIDFRNLSLTGGADSSFYVWDPKLYGSYGLGGYQTFSATTPIPWKPVPGGGSYGTTPNTKIQLGMGFFVHATGSAGTVQLLESSKTAGTNGNANGFRPMAPSSTIPYIEANLYAVSGSNSLLADGTIIGFDPAYSNNIDNKDNLKIVGFGDGMGILRGSTVLSTEQHGLISSGDVVPFRMINLKKQAYKIEVIASGISGTGTTAVLEDKYLNTATPLDLNAATQVTFNADPAVVASFKDRFRIVFTTPTPVTFTNVTAQQKNNGVQVNWNIAVENGVQQYEVERSQDGTNFITAGILTATANNGGSTTYTYMDVAPNTGINYYRIKTIETSGAVKYSTVVKVTQYNNTPGITLTSTFITDGKISLQLSNQPKGKYVVKLTNLLGQRFLRSSFNHAEGNSTQTIPVVEVNKGTYLLEIIKPSGEKMVQKIFKN